MNTTRVVLGIAAAGLLMGAAGPATAQVGATAGEEVRTIRVSGVGEYRVQPDEALVHLGVETFAATAQEAGQENARAMDRVIQALQATGIRREAMQTSGYSLFPQYSQIRPQPGQEPEAPRIVGYRATNQLTIRVEEVGRSGAVIDAGLEAGANRFQGISFQVRDPEAAQAVALERAVTRARRSAETIASALGVSLGVVVDASTSAEPPRPVFRAMTRDVALEAMQAPTPIEPGEETIRAVVSLVYAIQ